jgi:signal transduction histidine kinase
MAGRGLRGRLLVTLAVLLLLTVVLVSLAVLGVTRQNMVGQAQEGAAALARVAAQTAAAALDPALPLDAPSNQDDLQRLCELFASSDPALTMRVVDAAGVVIAAWPLEARAAPLVWWAEVQGDWGPGQAGGRGRGRASHEPPVLRVVRGVGDPEQPVAWVELTRGLGAVQAGVRSTQALLIGYALLDALLVLVVGFLLLTRVVVRPVEALVRATGRVADGDLQSEVDEARAVGELGTLARSFNRMVVRLRARVTELHDTNARLEEAQAQVQRAERLATLGQLSAGIAHEVGNPLSAVMGLLEVLGDEGLTEAEQADVLRRIEREVHRIDGTIRGLLDFARQRPRSVAVVDLWEPVRQACGLLVHHHRGRGVEVRRAGEQGPQPVQGDGDALTQVVLNLLLNAADAMQGSGVVTVEVAAGEAPSEVVLRVRDGGPGFSEAVAARAFAPFFTTKPPGEGTGLGLSVCEQMVASMGGSIRLVPGGSGGLVEVRLPRAPAAQMPSGK